MTAAERCRQWPHKWYGIWHGGSGDVLPAVEDYIDTSWSIPDMKAVQYYLAHAPVLFTVLGGTCLVDPSHHFSSRPRTDGVWLWFDDLVHYVDAHHVRLPDEMLKHIRSSGCEPPTEWRVNGADIPRALEWPMWPFPVIDRFIRRWNGPLIARGGPRSYGLRPASDDGTTRDMPGTKE